MLTGSEQHAIIIIIIIMLLVLYILPQSMWSKESKKQNLEVSLGELEPYLIANQIQECLQLESNCEALASPYDLCTHSLEPENSIYSL